MRICMCAFTLCVMCVVVCECGVCMYSVLHIIQISISLNYAARIWLIQLHFSIAKF